MVVVNHAAGNHRTLGGNLTTKREKRAYQIDLCLVKKQIFHVIKKVEVKQDIKGSDCLCIACLTSGVSC